MNQEIKKPEPFVSHLIELRNRLVWALGAVLLVFICLVPFAGQIYSWFAEPLLASLPEGGSMIAIDPHGTFFIPFKLAFAVAFAIAIPFVLYQVWSFIAPGLYSKEKRIVLPLVVSTTALFYLGILFAYFVVFPLMFEFFAKMTPEGVALTPDIGSYMSFALSLFFAFGVAFEVPVAIVLLTRIGVLSAETVAKQRPYFILGAFVLAMLMTPPDPFSQVMMAVPVCLLFELGLFVARKLEKNDLKSEVSE
ncbi:MAG: sec-independent protein translocase protein TatC [Arenicella sp.]|jgi:sec-independent protein translocase protein TatC